jgi:hypothetical protein
VKQAVTSWLPTLEPDWHNAGIQAVKTSWDWCLNVSGDNAEVWCIPSATSGVPRNFVLGGGGGQQIQLRTEDRDNGDLGAGSPLVWGSGGSCNLVKESSFHIVKFS